MNSVKVFAIALGIVAVILILTTTIARANPSSWLRLQSSSATTTQLAYLTPGTGTTTTPVLDTTVGNNFAPEGMAQLVLQLTGSTTPANSTAYATTTYRVDFEYSQAGIDYARPVATSTLSVLVGPRGAFITLGETTLAGVALATTTPTRIIIDVPTPTRFVRPVISIPIGSPSNGAVWAEWIAKKQVQ